MHVLLYCVVGRLIEQAGGGIWDQSRLLFTQKPFSSWSSTFSLISFGGNFNDSWERYWLRGSTRLFLLCSLSHSVIWTLNILIIYWSFIMVFILSTTCLVRWIYIQGLSSTQDTQVICNIYTGSEQVVLGKQTPGNTFHFLPTSTFNTLTTQDTGYTFHCKSPNTSSLTYCTCPRSVSFSSSTTPSLPRLGGSGSAELNFSAFSQVADARNTLLLLVLNTNTNRRVTHSY